jgi:ATP-dependent exoDNAse (exonuclease V) beta subunit
LDLWSPFQIRWRLTDLLAKPIEFEELRKTLQEVNVLETLRGVQEEKWRQFKASVHADNGWLFVVKIISDHCREKAQANDRKNRAKALALLEEFVAPVETLINSASIPNVSPGFFDKLRERTKQIGVFRWDGPTAKQLLDAIQAEMIPWFEPLARDELALAFTRDLIDLAAEAQDILAADKSKTACLVHDDLLLAAQALCEADPDAGGKPVGHILVDEFQDTDPIQWRMIHWLGASGRKAPRDLFLVGDAKQAIYAFRGADHTVAKTAAKILGQAGEANLAEHVLSDNFRSAGGILDFCNAAFDSIFRAQSADANPYNVAPQPLTPMRPDQGAGDAASPVMALCVNCSDKNRWAAEAAAVAGILKRIADGTIDGFASIAEKMSAGEPAVGILFRSYDPMTYYMTELTRADLPFSVYHGRTFFQTPEVRALINLISWLADPEDDLALAALLRSPLFPWTDEDLARLRWLDGNRREPLLRKLSALFQTCGNVFCPAFRLCTQISPGPPFTKGGDGRAVIKSPSENGGVGGISLNGAVPEATPHPSTVLPYLGNEALPAAPDGSSAPADFLELAFSTWTTLEKLWRLSNHVSLSETIRAALDAALAPLVLSGGERRGQAEANIEKLMTIVRQLEASESSSAQNIIRALRERIDRDKGEPEAESSLEGRGAIQLMTIHAAKGLEFAMVIPALCSRATRGRSHAGAKRISLADKEDPDGVKRLTLYGIDYSDPEMDMAPRATLLKAFVAEHNRLQESAEEKRLFYVALTRAKEHLLIPLPLVKGKAKVDPCSHAELLLGALPALANAAEKGAKEMRQDKASAALIYHTAEEQAAAQPRTDVEAQAEQIRQAVFRTQAAPQQIRALPYQRQTRLTVTDVMSYAKCPRRFYFDRFFAGVRMPGVQAAESGDGAGALGATGSPPGIGRIAGSVVHEILEKHEASVQAWKGGQPMPAELRKAVDQATSAASARFGADLKELRGRVRRQLENIARADIFGGKNISKGRDRVVLREVPFELEYDDFMVSGAIDRLEQAPDGAWRLWDYKTTQLYGRTKAEVVKQEAYDVQIWLYAWACNLILEQGVSSAGVVFTDASEAPLQEVEAARDTVEREVSRILSEMSSVLGQGVAGFKSVPSVHVCSACPCSGLGWC